MDENSHKVNLQNCLILIKDILQERQKKDQERINKLNMVIWRCSKGKINPDLLKGFVGLLKADDDGKKVNEDLKKRLLKAKQLNLNTGSKSKESPGKSTQRASDMETLLVNTIKKLCRPSSPSKTSPKNSGNGQHQFKKLPATVKKHIARTSFPKKWCIEITVKLKDKK